MWFYQAVAPFLNLPSHLSGKVKHFAIDSRQVQPGSFFIAIKGLKVDGHCFLQEVQERGAVCALVHESYPHKHPGLHLVYTPDPIQTLQKIAQAVVAFWQPIVIAITGSIGKTSTKEFIYTLVHKTHSITKTYGNQNTQLTLPLTILNAKTPTKYLLLEMGMDRPGELDKLIHIAPPDIAVLTHLAHVHVEAFDNFKRLAEEKVKIFQHPKTRIGFFSKDMSFSELALKAGCAKKVTCSLKDPTADYYLEQDTNTFKVYRGGQFFFQFIPSVQDPKGFINLLFAIALADRLQVPTPTLQKQLLEVTYPEKRMVQVEHNQMLFLNDAYNSCVDSVENALMTLPHRGGRRIAILSEMVEQGQYSVENHKKIATLALKHVDCLIGFGKEMEVMVPIWKKSGKKWAYFLTYSHMLAYVSKLIRKNDAVLVKGARKHALEKLIYDLTTA